MTPSPWIFSRTIDLLTFTGTAIISLVLMVLLQPASASATPEWTWITGVLLVDVAHVWSTAWITYADPVERTRRRALYYTTPLVCFAGALALSQHSADLLWRVVAYLAAFHFVRQQFGWMMMYRARAGQRERHSKVIDGGLIYLTMLYPLIAWHCNLPRNFWWMREGDFAPGLPPWCETLALVVYAMFALAYLALAIRDTVTRKPVLIGKHLLVVTTGACWYFGIVGTNSDYAFSVTNVFIHGIPYLVLVFVYGKRTSLLDSTIDANTSLSSDSASKPSATPSRSSRSLASSLFLFRHALALFLATLWFIAYIEELLWDWSTWHERSYLFGAIDLSSLSFLLVPLLVTPQLAHYVLDGFLWRRSNPRVGPVLIAPLGAQS